MDLLVSRYSNTFFALFLVIGIAARPSAAQTAANLTGAVADASGGALPGVQLTLRNTATGLRPHGDDRHGDGRFVFAGIPAGELRAARRAVGLPHRRPPARSPSRVAQTVSRAARHGGRRHRADRHRVGRRVGGQHRRRRS